MTSRFLNPGFILRVTVLVVAALLLTSFNFGEQGGAASVITAMPMRNFATVFALPRGLLRSFQGYGTSATLF